MINIVRGKIQIPSKALLFAFFFFFFFFKMGYLDAMHTMIIIITIITIAIYSLGVSTLA